MQELELFNTIIKMNPGLTADAVMELYKKMLSKFYSVTNEVKCGIVSTETHAVAAIDVQAVSSDPFNGHTFKALKVSPSKAITEESATCCICGKQMKILTEKHIQTHGLSKKAYMELCRYGKDIKLVARKIVKERRETIKKYQPHLKKASAMSAAPKNNDASGVEAK